MRASHTLAAAAALGASVCLAGSAPGATLSIWPVDPHVKVFRDTEPPKRPADATPPDEQPPAALRLRAARNEFEPAQLAIRATVPLEAVRVELSPLRHDDGKAVIDGHNLAYSFLGFIHLRKNTRDAGQRRLRPAPCDVPDPLLEATSIDLKPDQTQPAWLTVRVPKDATPGLYRGTVAVVAGQSRVSLAIELAVDPFTLPDARHLFVTNWFDAGHVAKAHKAQPWSERHWTLLERYARNMAEHRQNVVWVPWRLIAVTREPTGALAFDYTAFDRFVETFEKAGAADRLELRHVGHFGKGGWSGKEIVLSRVSAKDRKTGKAISLGPEEGLAPLLAALERHLAERGWLEKAMIHVADEPSINNVQSWRQASAFVHKAAPRLKRIDAIESTDFAGALEVWVPKLSHLDRWRAAYEEHRGDGEFWFYICCHPHGNVYPNRFLDYPLTAVRVLHWINFAADLAGYLHWGLTFWGDDPFGTPSDRLPPGDTHVLYPGTNGPLSSIRWEIQRESLEDYEYLHLLAAKTAALKKRLGTPAAFLHPDRRAKELCRRIVPAIADWEADPARIAAARAAVADEIIALDAEPLLLIETEPAEDSTLVSGPILIELRGITAPGATLEVNGRPTAVRPDGTFAAAVHGAKTTLRVEAEHNGKKRTLTRRFRLRK